jgi:hypothetical protein
MRMPTLKESLIAIAAGAFALLVIILVVQLGLL